MVFIKNLQETGSGISYMFYCDTREMLAKSVTLEVILYIVLRCRQVSLEIYVVVLFK